jgi:hypothetical protein
MRRPFLAVIFFIYTSNASAEVSDIGCQEADGVNNCARFTIHKVIKTSACNFRFSINRQDITGWKKRTDPSDADFSRIKKVVSEDWHTVDCCKSIIDGQNSYQDTPAWSNPRAVWNEVCRHASK